MEVFANIDWLPVIVGTIVSYGLGALWYSEKMFGTGWVTASGMNMKDLEAGKYGGMTLPMVTQSIATLGLAIVIGFLEPQNFALIFQLLLIATIAFLILSNGFWGIKGRYAIFTEASFIVVMGLIMIGTHSLFALV